MKLQSESLLYKWSLDLLFTSNHQLLLPHRSEQSRHWACDRWPGCLQCIHATATGFTRSRNQFDPNKQRTEQREFQSYRSRDCTMRLCNSDYTARGQGDTTTLHSAKVSFPSPSFQFLRPSWHSQNFSCPGAVLRRVVGRLGVGWLGWGVVVKGWGN